MNAFVPADGRDFSASEPAVVRTRRRNWLFSPAERRGINLTTETVSGALPCRRLPSGTKGRLKMRPAKFASPCFQLGRSQTGEDFARLNAAATRHCVPSRNSRNLLKTNDSAPFYSTLNRGVCVP